MINDTLLFFFTNTILFFLLQIDFWDNVYGFDMKNIRNIAITEPLVDMVKSRAVLTNAVPILSLDVLTCKKEVRT